MGNIYSPSKQLQCAVFYPRTLRKCLGLEKDPLTLTPLGVLLALRDNFGENAGNTADTDQQRLFWD